MFNKLKQIKDLREKAKRMQNALKDESVEATGGHGKLKMIMSGNQEVMSVSIDSELMDVGKKAVLEDAVKEATNSAIKKAQKLMVQKMQKMGELKI